jgi:hypothetical protein
VRLTEAQKAVILRHARQDAIEHLELIRDDLEDERRESLMTVLDYVAELEKTTAARNEDIGRLQNELGKAKARIAELEFQMSLKWPGVWQPVDDLTPEMVMFDLPDDCAICRKIEPAA